MSARRPWMDEGLVRLLQLAVRLGSGQPVTSAYIRERHGVSASTAKRDLVRLECVLPVVVDASGDGFRPQKVLRLKKGGASFSPLLRVAAGD